jgi:hypothetical protein
MAVTLSGARPCSRYFCTTLENPEKLVAVRLFGDMHVIGWGCAPAVSLVGYKPCSPFHSLDQARRAEKKMADYRARFGRWSAGRRSPTVCAASTSGYFMSLRQHHDVALKSSVHRQEGDRQDLYFSPHQHPASNLMQILRAVFRRLRSGC